jgi:hypothetical protein
MIKASDVKTEKLFHEAFKKWSIYIVMNLHTCPM